MTVSAEARELAGKTAAEIRRRGWVQGTVADYTFTSSRADCRVCLVGGITAVVTGNPEDGDDFTDGWKTPPPAMRELLDEIALRTYDSSSPHVTRAVNRVINWNDTGTRTKDEVLALLDSIAGVA